MIQNSISKQHSRGQFLGDEPVAPGVGRAGTRVNWWLQISWQLIANEEDRKNISWYLNIWDADLLKYPKYYCHEFKVISFHLNQHCKQEIDQTEYNLQKVQEEPHLFWSERGMLLLIQEMMRGCDWRLYWAHDACICLIWDRISNSWTQNGETHKSTLDTVAFGINPSELPFIETI